jgi:SulP family sulfate permease
MIFIPNFSVRLKDYKQKLIQDVLAASLSVLSPYPYPLRCPLLRARRPRRGLFSLHCRFYSFAARWQRVQISGRPALFVVIVYGIIAQYGMEGL